MARRVDSGIRLIPSSVGWRHVRDPFLQVGGAGLEALPLRKHHVEADRGAAYYEPEAILERLKY
jgi:hypothetical protein